MEMFVRLTGCGRPCDGTRRFDSGGMRVRTGGVVSVALLCVRLFATDRSILAPQDLTLLSVTRRRILSLLCAYFFPIRCTCFVLGAPFLL